MDCAFFTAEEAAGYLHLPLSTIHKFIQDKRLPEFRVGKHWRFQRETFHEWIKNQENKYQPHS